MNNFKKIGMTALAASLVSTSVFAGEMSVSGSAGINFAGADKGTSANGWSMTDSVTFSGGGEMDNGWNVTATFLLDNSDGRANIPGSLTGSQIFDNRSIAIDMAEAGTLEFWGQSGDSVVTATDDKLPNQYEEAWYGAGSPNTGAATSNMFYYSNAAIVDGLNVMASYTPSGTAEVLSSTEFGVTYSGVDGLTIGYAFGEVEETATVSNDESTLWIKYAMGPLTVGYQSSEVDGQTSTQDDEGTAFGISYAVSDALSISYGVNDVDLGSENSAGTDQEAEGISASYTMGGVSISVAMNEVKNAGGQTGEDHEAYDLNVAFAF